jgi:hypothetical protein
MSKQNNGLKVKQDQPQVRRATGDVLDVYRDKMTMVEISAGGRDIGTPEANAKRRTFTDFEEVDGKRTKVTRIMETLDRMLKRETITPDQFKAGIAFQLDFDLGQCGSMPSMRFDGMPPSGRGSTISLQILEAVGSVRTAMRYVGGSASDAGTVVWHVIGMRQSLNEFATAHPKHNNHTWNGILIGALCGLALCYGFGDHPKQSP